MVLFFVAMRSVVAGFERLNSEVYSLFHVIPPKLEKRKRESLFAV
jgi:hypothetical protein